MTPKPIIASDVGGIADMIGHHADILVMPGDTAKLASALIDVAADADLRRRIGAAAKERYQKLFSPAVVLPLMVRTYQKVIQNGDYSSQSPSHLDQHPWAMI